MKLNYEFLKVNVIKVELIEDLNMGPMEDFMDQFNGLMFEGLKVNDDDEAIIVKGTQGLFNVQPHNYHYEMTINGYTFDVAIDDDELNQYFKGIEFIKPNKYFIKEEA